MQPDNPSIVSQPGLNASSAKHVMLFGVILVSGLLLILVGIVLLGVVFYKGYDTLQNPAELQPWLSLRNEIHGLPDAKAEPDPSLVQKALESLQRKGPNLDFILGGYAILIIALLYIYVLARICLSMLSRGTQLILQALRYWRESEKDVNI